MLLTVSEGIWVAICKVHFIVIIFKLNLKGQCIVCSRIHSTVPIRVNRLVYFRFILIILIVGDVIAHSLPASLFTLSFFLGINEWLHAVIEGRVWLHEVSKMELVLSESFSIGHFEVEPLCVVISIIVCLENELVLKFI